MFAIERNIHWPGSQHERDSDYAPIYDALLQMSINDTIAITFSTVTACNNARKAAQLHARTVLSCYESGWRVQSTIKNTTLYIRKIVTTSQDTER